MSTVEDSGETATCPTCGATFGTERGMKTHHGLVHGESISELGGEDADEDGAECPTCGETFGGEHGVKIHHKRVHDESIAGVEIECEECGAVERREKGRIERHDKNFCSPACRKQYHRVYGTCDYCGSSSDWRESRYRASDRHFCGEECRVASLRGETHPRTGENGHPGRYGGSWQATANRIRDRDDGVCQRCEAERDGDAHHVHHIVPIQRFEDWGEKYEFVDVEDSHVERNLITLCSACHHDVDDDRSLCPAPPTSWRAD